MLNNGYNKELLKDDPIHVGWANYLIGLKDKEKQANKLTRFDLLDI